MLNYLKIEVKIQIVAIWIVITMKRIEKPLVQNELRTCKSSWWIVCQYSYFLLLISRAGMTGYHSHLTVCLQWKEGSGSVKRKRISWVLHGTIWFFGMVYWWCTIKGLLLTSRPCLSCHRKKIQSCLQ